MLTNALAGLTKIPQWFVWRLVPIAGSPKFTKVPVHPDGRVVYHHDRLTGMDAQKPESWTSYQTACDQLAMHQARFDGFRYTLGFMFTRGCGYFFYDLDGCVQNGTLSPWAQSMYAWLPGAFFEYSSSMTGVHFIGRCGPQPEHRTKPTAAWSSENPGNPIEFYTEGRGIAFGLNGQAWGNADTDCNGQALWLTSNIFKQEAVATALHGAGPRPDWKGPTDDNELLRRALKAQGAKALFEGKASFADLWTCNIPVLARTYPPDATSNKPFDGSSADFALASYLAFWTGHDVPRIERLMRLSTLQRDKWDQHRTYLADTIKLACQRTPNVLQDKPEPEMTQATGVLIPADSLRTREQHHRAIMDAPDDATMRNEVCVAIAQDASLEKLDRDFLANAIKRRMTDWGFPATINDCRAMVSLVEVESQQLTDGLIPAWVHQHVFVKNNGTFYNLQTGEEMPRTSFQAEYDRMMPTKPNGDREDSAQWCLQRWGMATVSKVMYVPTREPVYQHEGVWYANGYVSSSVPATAEAYTHEGVAGINLFLQHVQLLCSNRPEVFAHLMDWMAFCVQNPGVKVRHAPLIKGIQGDGKSMIGDVLRTTMGNRNIQAINPNTLKSDFGDWQQGTCVTIFEEIMMTGKERHSIANSLKESITNDSITINRKGAKVGGDSLNVTNQIAFTNHGDGVHLENTDRRWFVVFSPYSSVHHLERAWGRKPGEIFTAIFDSMKTHRGEWRKYFMEYAISPAFDRNAPAPKTEEKGEMQSNGEGAHVEIARLCIEGGGVGVSEAVLSSNALTALMRAHCITEGVEVPKTHDVNHMLVRLGYSKVPGQIKWNGYPHRIWWKRGEIANSSPETLRSMLELTKIKFG